QLSAEDSSFGADHPPECSALGAPKHGNLGCLRKVFRQSARVSPLNQRSAPPARQFRCSWHTTCINHLPSTRTNPPLVAVGYPARPLERCCERIRMRKVP